MSNFRRYIIYIVISLISVLAMYGFTWFTNNHVIKSDFRFEYFPDLIYSFIVIFLY